MLPISQVARRHGLSRSTLLYYDRIGLLRPSYRTSAGYRLYSADDELRLKSICRFRQGGMPLEEIADVLDADRNSRRDIAAALHRRLTALNQEIAALRRQQQVVLQLLAGKGRRTKADALARAMTKEKWVRLLRAAGMTDADMHAWHVAFERQSPLAHQDFLESLGLSAEETQRIRERSQ